MQMAERCAGIKKGEKHGRWTHEMRVAILYSVLLHLTKKNMKEQLLIGKK